MSKSKKNAGLQKMSATSGGSTVSQEEAEIIFLQKEIRSKTLPFMDIIMKGRASMNVLEKFRQKPPLSFDDQMRQQESYNMKNRSGEGLGSMTRQSAEHVVTAAGLKRRYPRFCEGLKFNQSFMSEISPKSDHWLINFIEECYDDAYTSSFKDVSDKRKRKRCGLYLGGLDSFSMVVTRLLTRIYR